MTLDERIQLVNLLYMLQDHIREREEEEQQELDDGTIDESIRTLICYLD